MAMVTDTNQIIQTIGQEEALGILDGSFKKGQGTSAWVINEVIPATE